MCVTMIIRKTPQILIENAYCSWSSAKRKCIEILEGRSTLQNRKDFISNLQNSVELFRSKKN